MAEILTVRYATDEIARSAIDAHDYQRGETRNGKV